MNVLLISPLIQECNYAGDYYAAWPQLGIAYIASILENNGNNVKIIEKKLLAGPKYPKSRIEIERVDNKLKEDMRNFRPDIVGLTATTPVIMDAYYTAKVVKENLPGVKIVIGGRHATSLPEGTLSECKDIDIVCIGEGEFTLLDLVNGVPLDSVEGIAYRRDGHIVRNPMRKLDKALDNIPSPAWHLLDQDFYFKPNASVMRGDYMRTATILTSRGCPYKCAFCQSPELLNIYGKDYIRYHSVGRVVGEIEYLMSRFGVRGISFSDDMFSLDKERLLKICGEITSRGINRNLKFIVNLRSDRVSLEILSALKKAGCIHVVFGSESGSELTLKRMKKDISISKNIEAIELTKKYGMAAEANIVIGSPGEKEEDFLDTINFLKKARPDKIFISKFYPLPGTEFFTRLLDEKIIPFPKNWNKINELYVENDGFTFADMPSRRFVELRNRLGREITVWTNTIYIIRNNSRSNALLALVQLAKAFLYTVFLYLDVRTQDFIKKLIANYNFKLRYLMRR